MLVAEREMIVRELRHLGTGQQGAQTPGGPASRGLRHLHTGPQHTVMKTVLCFSYSLTGRK